MIYHLTTLTAWQTAQAQGSSTADSLSSQGFIHCSQAAQVARSANKFFHGQSGLVLLSIAEERVTAPLKNENLEGGADLFPHIYGPLNLDAVVKVEPFAAGADGVFVFE